MFFVFEGEPGDRDSLLTTFTMLRARTHPQPPNSNAFGALPLIRKRDLPLRHILLAVFVLALTSILLYSQWRSGRLTTVLRPLPASPADNTGKDKTINPLPHSLPLGTSLASSPNTPSLEALKGGHQDTAPGVSRTSIHSQQPPYKKGPVQVVNYHGPTGLSSASLPSANSMEYHDLLSLATSPGVPSWTLTPRQACDVELLLNGGFSPLRGFMLEPTYKAVLQRMRLGDGFPGEVGTFRNGTLTEPTSNTSVYGDVLWPIPITLDIPTSLADNLHVGGYVALRDEYFNLVAVLQVGGLPWKPDKSAEATAVLGTTDTSHPGVAHLFKTSHDWYVGGVVMGLRLPAHFDFNDLRLTPAQVRESIASRGWARTVAFQTRNPMHRAHIHLAASAGKDYGAGVLIHPVVGVTKPGDVDYQVRVHCYRAALSSPSNYFAHGDDKGDGVMLALLPLAMRMGGPREAVWHAIIRKNYGASAFIVGRDHAGCKSSSGVNFYSPLAAQELAFSLKGELGLEILVFPEQVYSPARGGYLSAPTAAAEGLETLSLSGTALRSALRAGTPVPPWFTDPGVMEVLSRSYPPRLRRGFAVLFTGLSGSGKSTLATALTARLTSLLSSTQRKITFLDGDVARTHLTSGLGFSLGDRALNVQRLGWVAGEVVKHGGIAIAAPIAPAALPRGAFLRSVGEEGEWEDASLLVHVSTPLSVCVDRDAKGLYTGAVGAMLWAFNSSLGSSSNSYLAFHPFSQTPYLDLTGVSHPYEFPSGGGKGVTADITINTDGVSTEEGASAIVAELWRRGYLDLDVGGVNSTSSSAPIASANELLFVNWLKKRDSGKFIATDLVLPQPKISFSPEKGADLDPAAQFCTSSPHAWDSFSVTSGSTDVLLHGGLPLKGSPTAYYFSNGISISRKPSQLHFLLAPSSQLFNFILDSLNQSHSLSLFEVSNERVKMAEDAGKKEFDKKQPWLPSKDLLGPFHTVHLLNQSQVAPSYPQINTLDPWLLVNDGGGSAYTIPDPVALYASYDLWSYARWAHQSSLLFVTHPRFLFFLQRILRLDPCAHATVAVPKDHSSLINNISEAIKDTEGGSVLHDETTISTYSSAYLHEVEEAMKFFPGRVRVFRV